MRPAKYSPQKALPPISSAPFEVMIAPATATLLVSVPFT